MYDETKFGFFRERAKREYENYRENSNAWLELAAQKEHAWWVFFGAIYVLFGTISLIYFFPSISDINGYIATSLFQTWFPVGAGFVGLLLVILKYKWLIAYGATELIFASFSASAAVKQLATKGVSEWAIAVAAVYLFVRGFENIGNGIAKLKKE